MKKMTCKQLGGACDFVFEANTFEEIAEQSKKHGMEMFQAGNEDHLKAMRDIKHLMQSPEAMQSWFQSRRDEFNSLAEE